MSFFHIGPVGRVLIVPNTSASEGSRAGAPPAAIDVVVVRGDRRLSALPVRGGRASRLGLCPELPQHDNLILRSAHCARLEG